MAAHSSLGASSAKRWMTCPGSVALCAAVPQAPSSAAAAEGTAAHWVAEQHLLEAAGRKFEQPVINLPCPENGVKVTLDMVTHSRLDYVGYIKQIAGVNLPTVRVESRLDLSSVVYPGMFGTCDSWFLDEAERHLHVIDYKYGAGVEVDAQDNPQGAFYAIGAAVVAGVLDTIEQISFHIVQPRISREPSVWTFDRATLLQWVERFKQAAIRAMTPDAPRIYDAEACRWCSGAQCDPATGRSYCPEYDAAAVRAVEAVTAAANGPSVSELTPEQLAEQLRLFRDAEALIKRRMAALQQWGLTQANEMGRDIPGFKLVQRRATRKWRDAEEVIAVFRFGMGLTDEQIFSSEVISPAQAEKLRDDNGCKIIAPDVISAYTEKADNGVELVPADDKRPAVAARARLADYVLPEGLTPFVNEEK